VNKWPNTFRDSGNRFVVPKWKMVCSDQWNNARRFAAAESSIFLVWGIPHKPSLHLDHIQ